MRDHEGVALISCMLSFFSRNMLSPGMYCFKNRVDPDQLASS